MKTIIRTCQYCRYFSRDGDSSRGLCLRRAPTIVPAGDPWAAHPQWPIVCDVFWCGEYEAKLRLSANAPQDIR